jgi:uncharacterized membrane-anchored protein
MRERGSSAVGETTGCAAARVGAGFVLRKLPEVTALFWLVKTVAVTLGETLGDLLGITVGLGYLATAALFLGFLAVAVTAQVRAARLYPALYWAAVLGTSLVGTEVSDLLNRGFGHGSAQHGVGYAGGALILGAVLLAVFLVWWRTGQTYDVEAIASRQGEILYWAAILASNTLGTSSGDWLADDTALGFRGAFTLIAIVLLLLAAARYLTAVNPTVLFWPAFVLTRPLGAAGGDALTKPVGAGGLGWGTAWGSAALAAWLIALILHQTRQVRRRPPAPLPAPVDRRTGRAQRPNAAPAAAPHASPAPRSAAARADA